ncbi:unnamed protein product [Ilex paraguariensis]|uniref:Tesmin/TSO1-like CXC domain-containing protein n=1 Tax=Ilex paraguariensis TaxID=185542 RepID=A0ABC8V159_9AQUA
MAAQMQRMRSEIEQLQAELLYFRGDSGAPFEELQILKHKISLLEASNAELQRELQEHRISCELLTQRAIDAQVEKDRLIMKIESAQNGKSWDEIDSNSNQDFDLVKNYVSKIQELEGEVLRLQRSNRSRHSEVADYHDLDYDGVLSKNSYFTVSDSKAADMSGEEEGEEKELEHSSLQEKLDRELKELDKKLEQKEAEMKRFTNVDTSVLKQHYEKKVHELEQEKRSLQKEIEDLRCNLANISSNSDESAQKLKGDYLQKLNVLEAQVAELKKKQDAQAQLLRQKQRSDEAAKRLNDEIQRIKTQKVQLQQKIKQESEQFRLWKASREKEVLQLKKEGRRNEYEMHKLLALNQRQKMVLQRKTEEASMATKRLKDLLESRRSASREASAGNSNGPGIQALMQAIEHELEVTVRVHEVRLEYERQMEERARMAKEVAELKEESQILKQRNLSGCPQKMSPGARNSRLFALENMLATSSSTLVSMASQLSEAEEHERAFSGRGRWNQVRSLAEAKNIMNYLFNLASSSRCQLRDREVDCREKDSEIRDLKEKVFNLVRQLEMQKAELIRQEKLKKLTPTKHSKEKTQNSEAYMVNNEDGHVYDLRHKVVHALQGSQNSIVYNGESNIEILEDMDTAESEHSDLNEADDDCEWEHSEVEAADEDGDWVTPLKERKRRQAKKKNSTIENHSGTGSNPVNISDMETTGEADSTVTWKTASGICCSCSKQSSCKTRKCECRAAEGCCGMSCGCEPTRCSNRNAASTTELGGLQPLELAEGTGNFSGTDQTDRSHILASHGAMLLESALSEKPAGTNDESGARRKPLSDIGNTLGKSNVPKPNQRKKWRKSVIQLVPAAPPPSQTEIVPVAPPSSQTENTEGPKKSESISIEANIPLKLPRAMRSAFSSTNPLKERNSNQPNDSTLHKESGAPAPRSPQRHERTTDEKENHGL